jgi:CheY-like chemotaxis protein
VPFRTLTEEPSSGPRIEGGPLVLVVDDDRDSRESTQLVLEDEGYTVDVAPNGRAALDRLSHAPSPVLLLVDLMMPVMDGASLLAALEASADHAAIPVVVMTASGPDPRTSGLRYPVLRKPFKLEDLIRIVTSCAPRLWDEDELPTDETGVPSTSPSARYADATPRTHCIGCDARAATRCTGCGEAFCRRCIDAGPGTRCPRCRRASSEHA